MIDFSIIVPSYNSPNWTIRLIKSLKINSHKNIEIIIVDDQSDVSIQKLSDYCDSLTNVFLLSNSSKGAGSARNFGLERSRGRWIIFADADDFFMEDYYETIQKYKNSNASIIYLGCTSIFEETKELSDRHIFVTELLSNYLAKKNRRNELAIRTRWVTPWGKMFNKEFLEDYQIRFENVPVSNDLFFSVKSGVHAKSIEGDSRVIYCVTKSNNSLTSGVSCEEYEMRTKCIARSIAYINNNLSYIESVKTGWSSKSWLLKQSQQYEVSFRTLCKCYLLLKQNGLGLLSMRGII